MSKTIREWFEELPEPYRTQAIANTKIPNRLDREESSLEKAILNAFEWDLATEGFDYWCDTRHKVLNAQPLEPVDPPTDLPTLVRAFLAAKDELARETLDTAAEEKLQTAEKALRKAVGL